MNTYISAMIDSLNKKIGILEEIHQKDETQFSMTQISPFPYEEYDGLVEEKSVLIYKLNKLDEGFELVYNNLKDEITTNKDLYKDEIKTMQDLITRITDLSVQIQAEESRNKNALECAFRDEKRRLKDNRSSVKAVRSYTQTMRASAIPGIWDEKK